VTVLEEGPSLGRELSIVRRWRVLDGLRQHGAELLTEVTINEIGRKAISYATKEGEARSLAVDSVVLAIGARPDDRLAKELETFKVPVISIGDGAAIGYIEGALASGFAAGNRV
jgi:NADH dehydrogenase FAD-containing subunit